MNDWQKNRFALKMIQTMFNTIAGKKIALFGFAFKKNTGDTRETAALSVCKVLLGERAKISIYDPKVAADQVRLDFEEQQLLTDEQKFEDFVTITKDAYEAAKGAHAIAILTEWDEFRTYDYKRIYKDMCKPCFIFDGRLILNHEELRAIGFEVHSVGKPYGATVRMDD